MSGGYRALILADGATGYWRLGESSGTTANDETTNHNGTYSGSPTLGVRGLLVDDPDTAVTFASASSQHVQITGGSWMGTNAISLEVWVRVPAVAPASHQAYAGLRTVTDGPNAFYILHLSGGTTLECRFRNSGGTNFDANPTIVLGRINHVVMTYDGTNVRAYVNGVQSAVNSTASGSLGGTYPDLQIAGSGDSVATQYFDGTVDEVAYYGSTTLSATQVATHYAAGIAEGYMARHVVRMGGAFGRRRRYVTAQHPAPPVAAFDPSAGFPWAREGGEVVAVPGQDDTPQAWSVQPPLNAVIAQPIQPDPDLRTDVPVEDPNIQTWAVRPPAEVGVPFNQDQGERFVADTTVAEPDSVVAFDATDLTPFDASAGFPWARDDSQVQQLPTPDDTAQPWAVQPPASVAPFDPSAGFPWAREGGETQAVPGADDTPQAWSVQPPLNAAQALVFNQPDEAPYAPVEDPTSQALVVQPPAYIPVFQLTAWSINTEDESQAVPTPDETVPAWNVRPPLNAVQAQAWNTDDTPVGLTQGGDDTAQALVIQPPPFIGSSDDIVQPVWWVADDTSQAWAIQPPIATTTPSVIANEPQDVPYPWMVEQPDAIFGAWAATFGAITSGFGGRPPVISVANPSPPLGVAAAVPSASVGASSPTPRGSAQTPNGAASSATPSGEAG